MMETSAANTTDEEGELVTHDDLLEPQEQLSKLRELGAEEVKKAKVEECKLSPANYDIEHNIREIRAILRMNAEIFERCMEFCTGVGGSVLPHLKELHMKWSQHGQGIMAHKSLLIQKGQ